MSKFGGEWKTERQVISELRKLKSEGQKRIALEWQLRYHKSVLKLGEILNAEQKGLLKLTNISVQQIEKNLIDILNISPMFQQTCRILMKRLSD